MHNNEQGYLLSHKGAEGLKDYDTWTEKIKRNKRLIIGIVAGVVLVVALGVGLIIMVTKLEDTSNDNPHYPPPSPGPVVSKSGSVAAENEVCSKVGVGIMQNLGGNAIDAAVATCLCQGILNPFSSGIGGGGVMLVRLADGTVENIDFREVAPAAATEWMYYGNPASSVNGGLSVAVPGELAGLEYAYKKYGSGKVTWKQLVQPAIDLARNASVGPLLAIRIKDNMNLLTAYPVLGSIYAPNGVPKKQGEYISQPILAATLQEVADKGAFAFYDPAGTIAPNLVKDINAAGGNFTVNDLDNFYKKGVMSREVQSGWYQGYQYFGGGPPFSGGVCLVLALNILERYNIPLLHRNVQAYHWIVESLAFTFSDRMALGDPLFVNLTDILPIMKSKEHSAFLRSRLRANQTFPYTYYTDLVNLTTPLTGSGTTHLSVVDSARNAVALTSTVNTVWGSKVLSPSTGVLLNNEMDDFATSNKSNSWNLAPSKANKIVPGKKPLSSMSPSIILRDGKLWMVTGASGGARIITAVLQVFLNVLLGDDMYVATSRPRIHHQLVPPVVYYEPGVPQDIITGLQKIGHQLVNTSEIAYVQSIMQDSEGLLYAASDPRKLGKPAGY